MTEQEFRELTAYQPPAPPKQSPGVASIAAAVAGAKPQASTDPPVPVYPPAQAHETVPPSQADSLPPPPPPIPAQANIPTQTQYISQIHEQPVAHTLPPTPQPVQASIPAVPPVPVPVSVPAPVAPAPVQHAPATPPAPEPHRQTSEMIPQEKHDELMEQFVRLNDRYKRIVEERDALSRQVTELRRVIAERQASGEPLGHDYKEEIRLLGKLLDDEQSLRKAAMESGVFKPSQDTYARHDRLVNVFLNIVGRDD